MFRGLARLRGHGAFFTPPPGVSAQLSGKGAPAPGRAKLEIYRTLRALLCSAVGLWAFMRLDVGGHCGSQDQQELNFTLWPLWPKWPQSVHKGGAPCFDQFFSKIPGSQTMLSPIFEKKWGICPRWTIRRGGLHFFPGFGERVVWVPGIFPGSCF